MRLASRLCLLARSGPLYALPSLLDPTAFLRRAVGSRQSRQRRGPPRAGRLRRRLLGVARQSRQRRGPPRAVLAARGGPLQRRCLPSSLLRRSFVAPRRSSVQAAPRSSASCASRSRRAALEALPSLLAPAALLRRAASL